MDDFDEFRARSYSGGFIPPPNRPTKGGLDNRRISLTTEPPTRRHLHSTLHQDHASSQQPTPNCPCVASTCSNHLFSPVVFAKNSGTTKGSRRVSLCDVILRHQNEDDDDDDGDDEYDYDGCDDDDDDDKDGEKKEEEKRRNGGKERGRVGSGEGVGGGVISGWQMADMRPRVSSAPPPDCAFRRKRSGETCARKGSGSAPVNQSRQRVRRFSLTPRGLVCEGYAYVPDRSTIDLHNDLELGPDPSPRSTRPSTSGVFPANLVSRNNHMKDIPTTKDESGSKARRRSNRNFRLHVIGGRGTGKTSILSHFVKPESGIHGNASDDSQDGCSVDEVRRSVVCVVLDEQLFMIDITEVTITDSVTSNGLIGALKGVDGCLVVYSVEDRRSFEIAIDCLYEFKKRFRLRGSGGASLCSSTGAVVTLTANKSDLVRTRVISEQEGRSAAKTYGDRYIEVSATIGLNIDQLLIGALKQMRIAKQRVPCGGSTRTPALSTGEVGAPEVAKGSLKAALRLRFPCLESSCACLLCARRHALVKFLRQ